MSSLTLFVLQLAFLAVLWVFIFAIVYALRTDLFGPTMRRIEQAQRARQTDTDGTPVVPAGPRSGEATKLVVTAGPKEGLEIPLNDQEQFTIGALLRVESGDPRRLHLHSPRALDAVERPVDGPRPRLH